MAPNSSKDSLRARVLAGRQALAVDQSTADAARTRQALDRLGQTARTISLYVSRPGEPATLALIDALAEAGWRILLPVVSKGRAEPDWAWFEGWGHTHRAWGGIPQPTGQHLGADAVSLADIVIVSCLAVGLDGSRLGTGGGWYDRALLHRRSGVPIWAFARDAEVMDSIPSEPHDVKVDALVTQTRFLTAMPAAERRDGPSR